MYVFFRNMTILPFLNWITWLFFPLLVLSYISSLYIFRYWIYHWQISSLNFLLPFAFPFCWWFFFVLLCKSLLFWCSPYSFSSFVFLAYRGISINTLLIPVTQRLLPMFDFSSFMVSGPSFMSLIHFKIIFLWCQKVV